MNLRELVDQVDAARDSQDEWCSVEKAHALAAIVVAVRPELVVEVGVWRGASLIPQLLALRHLGCGRAIAIDPWHVDASVAEENTAANVEWWSKVDHEVPFTEFKSRIQRLGIASLCDIWRKRSDDCEPPAGIGLLHVDGNHNEQAYRDVTRFAPQVNRGGFLVLDDLGWTGGGVDRAHDLAKHLGFVDRYPLGKGIVLQRG